MAKKSPFDLKVAEEIEVCNRLLSNDIESRHGSPLREQNLALLITKIKELKNYLPKIKDKVIYDRCKNIINTAKF